MSLQKLAHISASRENLMKVATCFFVFFFFFAHAVQHVRPKQIRCVDESMDSSSSWEHAPRLQFMAVAWHRHSAYKWPKPTKPKAQNGQKARPPPRTSFIFCC